MSKKNIKRFFSLILSCSLMFAFIPSALASNYANTTYVTRYDCSSGVCVPSAQKTPASTVNNGTVNNGVNYTPVSASSQELELLRMLNAERAKYGLKAFTLDTALSGVAKVKCQDMIKYRYFSHQSARLGNVRDMLGAAKISYRCANENIARYGSLQKAFAGLMSSVAHRNSILSKNYTHVGLSVCSDGNGTLYVVQVFICK